MKVSRIVTCWSISVGSLLLLAAAVFFWPFRTPGALREEFRLAAS